MPPGRVASLVVCGCQFWGGGGEKGGFCRTIGGEMGGIFAFSVVEQHDAAAFLSIFVKMDRDGEFAGNGWVVAKCLFSTGRTREGRMSRGQMQQMITVRSLFSGCGGQNEGAGGGCEGV